MRTPSRTHLAAALALLAVIPLRAVAQNAPVEWNEPPGLPFQAGPGAGCVAMDPDTVYLTRGRYTAQFTRFTISTATWTPLPDVPERVDHGGLMVRRPGTALLYVLCGGSKRSFFRYDPAAGPSGTWTPMAPLPQDPHSSMALSAAGDGNLYLMGGGNSTAITQYDGRGFWKYAPDAGAGSWVQLSSHVPTSVMVGSTLHYPGSGHHVYAALGFTQEFWRYTVTTSGTDPAGMWARMADLPETAVAGTALAAGPGGSLYAVLGDATGFHRYDFSGPGGSWVRLADRPGPSMAGTVDDGGGGLVWPGGGDTIFGIRGSNTKDLWRYSISRNSFTSLAYTPAVAGYVSAVTGIGDGNHLYALQGGSADGFSSYSTVSNEWMPLASPFGTAGNPSLVHDGGDFLYAAPGGIDYRAFWRYSLDGQNSEGQAAGSWLSSSDSPDVVGPLPEFWTRAAGDGMVVAGGNIYASFSQGQSGTYYFYRYSPSDRRWSELTGPSGPFGVGGGMVYPGSGDLIYALQGGGISKAFWTYSISGNLWNAFDPADFQERVGAGGGLSYPGSGREIFAFGGKDSDTLWIYTLPTASDPGNTWRAGPAAPGTIGVGAALAYPGGHTRHLYAFQGRYTRQMWRFWMDSDAPSVPTGLQQRKRSGGTLPPPGTITRETGFQVLAAVSDPYSDSVKLQVRVKPSDAVFLAADPPTAGSAPVSSGSTASVAIEGLVPGTRYHWQARTIDSREVASAWVDFPGTLEVLVNHLPITTSTEQVAGLTGIRLPVGGTVLTGEPLLFRAAVDDGDEDACFLEIEVLPSGEAFRNVPTGSSPMSSAPTAEVTLAFSVGRYHWQFRTVDAYDGASPWTSFGGNGEDEDDFAIEPFGSINDPGSCLSTAAGPSARMAALLFAAVAALAIPRGLRS